MTDYHSLDQRIEIDAEYDVEIEIFSGLDFGTTRGGKKGRWTKVKSVVNGSDCSELGKTQSTNQFLACFQHIDLSCAAETEAVETKYSVGMKICTLLKDKFILTKHVTSYVDKNGEIKEKLLKNTKPSEISYEDALKNNIVYFTLSNAKERAKELDCKGACYPIATLNGNEACDLWQHASLQFQPSTGVAYGVMHYVNVTKDTQFLTDYGMEMLLEISRFLLSRREYGADGKFGYFCVMGPDEFQMVVNHNCYTNYMAKKTFEYTVDCFRKFADNEHVKKH